MRKIFPFVTCALLATGLLATGLIATQGQDRTLIFYTWSDYMDPQIIKNFEQKFKVKVAQSFYESDDDMFAKLRLNGTNQYDLVVPSTALGTAMIRSGVLKKLEAAKLPNLKNLGPRFRKLPNGASDYLVPYQWGTMGVAYRSDKVPKLEQSWAVFFDPKKQAGPFAMLDVPHETIGAALKFMGKSLNSRNANEVKGTLPMLESAVKRSVGLTGGTDAGSKLAAGLVTYAMTYSGNAIKIAEENKQIKYFIPKEGSELFLDAIAIPAQAPHADLAYQFINYLLEPKVAAQLSNYNRYGTPNAAAKPFILPADLANPIIYPSEKDMGRLELIDGLEDAVKVYDAVWTRLKAR